MSRIILMVDEFQDFFAESDDLSRKANSLLDQLVRKGRAAGIHIILCSQTLGTGHLLGSTKENIKVRIALQCSREASSQVFADGNNEAQFLNRPGQAIYNDQGGMVDGNRHFQVALLPPEARKKRLESISARAGTLPEIALDGASNRKLVIFEGNELPEIINCRPLLQLLNDDAGHLEPGQAPTFWLGEEISMAPPLNRKMPRDRGSNLIVISREEEEGVGICLVVLLSLLLQYKERNAIVYNFDLTYEDAAWAEYAEDIRDWYSNDKVTVLGPRNTEETLQRLTSQLESRLAKAGGGVQFNPIFLVFQGMHRLRDLRTANSLYRDPDDKSPSVLLEQILKDGPEVGIHTIAWADTVSNMKRCLSYRGIGEFGYRATGALSNEDSQSLLEDSAASRIHKLHRYLLYDERMPGRLTLFRPYSILDRYTLRKLLNTQIREGKGNE